jgi:hypothetical protein
MSHILKAGFLCAVGVCLSLTCAAPVGSEVFSVPTSDTVILGSLVLDNGVVAKFRAREGTMVTVRENGGLFWGIIPQVVESADRKINIIPFKITDLEIIGQSKVIKAGDSGQIRSGSASVIVKFEDLTVGKFRYPAPADPDSIAPKQLQGLFGTASGDFCCLSCGGATVCANGVSMSCGSCYAGGGGRLPV